MTSKDKDYRNSILNKKYKRIFTLHRDFLNEIEVIEYIPSCELPIIHKKGVMCLDYFQKCYEEITPTIKKSDKMNYKEKALYHIKNNMSSDCWSIDYTFNESNIFIKVLNKELYNFISWEDCYKYLKKISKSTKRAWVEDKMDCRLVLWNTDLEPEEQDCVTYLLEYFNYEQGSFQLEELREILAENTEDENIVNACDIMIKSLIKNSKETIEME